MVRFVVMAAGQATRMGQDKLVMPWGKSTVLGFVLQTVLDALELQVESCTEIYVVARHPIEAYASEETIARFRAYSGTWLQVPTPKPLAETIRLGLQDLNSEIEEIGFLPGDQVGVTVLGLTECLLQVLRIRPDFLVPIAGNRTGSPVFFHRRYVPELLALRGEQGGREVLKRYPDRWSKYSVEESLFQDVDTPEDYQCLLEKGKVHAND
ncbi:nucleotidyltransferase family protein [Desulfosporosinus metallidurans]|uniref:CTP:molybdopterin cytidylyltransferase n=1 Tax=Desulfosporosinus metallidurans TaxID=1888891 RepID=A0A1Q8QZ98_9FIRM|nr:nucleotidyltransferase family protein [Desulfosporosinus metallidurans]OLN32692.1 CTP:molybdopterin cytidylyltransferase [Desulfosporosinus metallidurans]